MFFFGGITLILSSAKIRFSIQSIDKIIRQTSNIVQKKKTPIFIGLFLIYIFIGFNSELHRF